MPCRSDHLEPTAREEESNRVAKYITELNGWIKITTPRWIREAAAGMYGNAERCDELTRILCGLCLVNEDLIFDIRHHARREMKLKIATWYDRHLKADKKRRAREAARKKSLTNASD